VIEQRLDLILFVAVTCFAKNRHERLGESPFGEQAAQQVGNPECNPERIGQRAGTEGSGNQNIAGQARNARKQGEAADGGGRP
jgi:hypothetical protein